MEHNDLSNTKFIENADKTVIVIIGQWYYTIEGIWLIKLMTLQETWRQCHTFVFNIDIFHILLFYFDNK